MSLSVGDLIKELNDETEEKDVDSLVANIAASIKEAVEDKNFRYIDLKYAVEIVKQAGKMPSQLAQKVMVEFHKTYQERAALLLGYFDCIEDEDYENVMAPLQEYPIFKKFFKNYDDGLNATMRLLEKEREVLSLRNDLMTKLRENLQLSQQIDMMTSEQQNNKSDMRIFAKSLTGKDATVYVTKDTTVYELKKMIQIKTGIPIQDQRLIFEGRQMEDEVPLMDYSVKPDSIIRIVQKLMG